MLLTEPFDLKAARIRRGMIIFFSSGKSAFRLQYYCICSVHLSSHKIVCYYTKVML